MLDAPMMKKNATAGTNAVKDLVQAKIFSSTTTSSLKTQLASYLISFNYPSDEAYWRELASTGTIVHEGKTINLNKSQRYECIRYLAQWGYDFEELFNAEFAREYSDDDEHAKLRIQSSKISRESKQAVWDSYLVPEQWK